VKHAVQGVVEALRVHAALPLDVSWNCIIVADDVAETVLKNFQDSSLHQIFRHIHEALNVILKNNQLHSLVVNDEMNLLSLISP